MFTVAKSNIRTIRPGDPKFLLNDTFTVCQRASIEISKDCPTGDANILKKAKEQAKLNELTARRAPEAFREVE
jgi:hypothetical protein